MRVMDRDEYSEKAFFVYFVGDLVPVLYYILLFEFFVFLLKLTNLKEG